jgi:hypothetical protein
VKTNIGGTHTVLDAAVAGNLYDGRSDENVKADEYAAPLATSWYYTLLPCCPTQAEEGGVTIRWLRGWGLAGAMSMAATAFASTTLADPDLVSRPTPGMHVADGNGGCTAAFAAQGTDGRYYLLTSGHCDPHDGSVWTYGADRPLGMITASEKVGETKDAAIIRLDPSVGAPRGDVGDRYSVRDVLNFPQIQVGMPFCKLGAVTGETCGIVTGKNGDVIEASVYSLDGDSGSPGFVKNADGTVSAVGILMSSPDGDDYTTYFILVYPVLTKWGLHILP